MSLGEAQNLSFGIFGQGEVQLQVPAPQPTTQQQILQGKNMLNEDQMAPSSFLQEQSLDQNNFELSFLDSNQQQLQQQQLLQPQQQQPSNQQQIGTQLPILPPFANGIEEVTKQQLLQQELDNLLLQQVKNFSLDRQQSDEQISLQRSQQQQNIPLITFEESGPDMNDLLPRCQKQFPEVLSQQSRVRSLQDLPRQQDQDLQPKNGAPSQFAQNSTYDPFSTDHILFNQNQFDNSQRSNSLQLQDIDQEVQNQAMQTYTQPSQGNIDIRSSVDIPHHIETHPQPIPLNFPELSSQVPNTNNAEQRLCLPSPGFPLACEQNQLQQQPQSQIENKHAMQLVEEMLQDFGLEGAKNSRKHRPPDTSYPNLSQEQKQPVKTQQVEINNGDGLGDGTQLQESGIFGISPDFNTTLTSYGLLSLLQAKIDTSILSPQQQGALKDLNLQLNQQQAATNSAISQPQNYNLQLNVQDIQKQYQAGMLSEEDYKWKLQEVMFSPGFSIQQSNLYNRQEYYAQKKAEIDALVNQPPKRELPLLNMNFNDLAAFLEPTPEERLKMERCQKAVFNLLHNKFPHTKCFVYGSAGNRLCIREHNDLDLCIRMQNVDDSQEAQGAIVDQIAAFMDEQGMQEVRSLAHARVPICKFTFPETGTHVDVSVNNLLPVFNTRLLAKYCEIDSRVRGLVYVVKFWAKRRILNDPYHNTLSSYAYVLMVIFFLQQKGLLPCLQEMGNKQPSLFSGYDVYFLGDVSEYCQQNPRALPDVQMGELTMMFFDFYAWEFFEYKCRDSVICVRLGEFISKESKGWTCKTGSGARFHRHLLSIEDPFETEHDLGKLVDKNTLAIITREFQKASKVLHLDAEPQKCLFKHRRWSPDGKRKERPPRGWKPRETAEQNNGAQGDSEGENGQNSFVGQGQGQGQEQGQW
eukprot:TRINITY_DN16619_c0_g1_i4.p1 TRINITY_DN16619_c0_g1~~TRINITY_DN16619_c0_g1_i4.p1  ORF type:complete len:982 (-),score=137.66 TRINITY_DN16619_c0_g1_i4:782-3532(-)